MKPKKPHPFSRKLPSVPREVTERASEVYEAWMRGVKGIDEEERKRRHWIARTERMMIILDFYTRYEAKWEHLCEKYKLTTLPQRFQDKLYDYYHYMIELQNS